MQVEAQTVHDHLAFGGVEKLADSEQWVPVRNGQQPRCSHIRWYSIALMIRNWAKKALTKVGGPSVVCALMEVVRNPQRVNRDYAVEFLGDLGDQAAIPCLMEALGEPDTRIGAIEALGKLAKPGSPAVPALVSLLSDSRLQEVAGRALANIADPATIDALVGILDVEALHWTVRDALRRIGTPEAQRALAAKLRERRA
jgi:HEAT repeat protein